MSDIPTDILISVLVLVVGVLALLYCLNSSSEAVGFLGGIVSGLVIFAGLVALAVSVWW